MTRVIFDKIAGPLMHDKPKEIIEYNTLALFPSIGRSGLLYIAKDTSRTYRFDIESAVYIETSTSPDNPQNTPFKVRVVNTDPAAVVASNLGYYYNFPAVSDARNIAAIGWHVPTKAEVLALRAHLDPGGNEGVNVAGGKMKQSGLTGWNTPNTGANNESGFNAIGSGKRNYIYELLKLEADYYTSSACVAGEVAPQYIGLVAWGYALLFNSARLVCESYTPFMTNGLSVRLVKDITLLADGQIGSYIGNDGTIYPTICIGAQEWISVNLAESKYRDGSDIPTVGDKTAWLALNTGAKSAFNNDPANAVTAVTEGATLYNEAVINPQDILEIEEGANIDVTLVNKKINISAPLPDYVQGPANAVDSRICLFDAATGKLIKLSNVSIDANGTITILGGTATILGKKALVMPTGTAGIDSGLSIRDIAGESIIQFGNNLSDYYTGAINQAKSGSMIRLDTRDAAPIPGGHAYSAFQIQVRVAGAAYTAYKVPVQIAGGAPEGALCISPTGVVSVYYGLWTAGQITSTLPTGTAPLVIASQTKVANLNVQFLDGKEAGAVNGIAELDTAGTLKTTQIPAVENLLSYGIAMDSTVSNPICPRVGNMELPRSLPIQSKMRGCVIDNSTGEVVYYLHPTDWSKRENGTASNRDGSDGQVVVEIPSHWRKITQVGTIQIPRISEVELPGFTYIPKYYIGAYEGSVQRSVSKLCSVINADADYRGGNNNAAYDAATNTFLGRPATVISRTDFRTYARNRGASTNWNQLTYDAYKSVFYLYMIEYANLHSQSAYNAAKDGNGYAQGGLGNGVTDLVSGEWAAFNGYHPFVPCGHSDSLGNFTGEVTYNALDFGGAGVTRSTKVCRYRGLENIFGHIWKWIDGINVETQSAADGGLTKLWVSKNPLDFTDANYINYTYLGNLGRSYDYIKTMLLGEIMPETQGGGAGTTTYFGDHSWLGNIPGAGTDLRAVIFGARADYAGTGGLATSYAYDSPAHAHAHFGGRLCFLGA